MVKLKYDVSQSDAAKAAGGDFEQPKPGVYKAKVVSIKTTHPKNQKTGQPDESRQMLEVVYEITDKKFKGSRLWDYIVDFDDPESSSNWKYDQFLQAFSVASKKKRKGTFDTDDIIGEACKIRVKAGSYNGAYSADLGAVILWDPEEDEDDDDDVEEDDEELEDEDDLDEEEEDDEEEDDEEEEEDEEDDDESESDYLTEESLMELTLAEVKAIATDDFELEDLPKGKSKIVAAILEAQGADEGDESSEDYDDWSVADLKAELKDRELPVKGKQKELAQRLKDDDAEEPF